MKHKVAKKNWKYGASATLHTAVRTQCRACKDWTELQHPTITIITGDSEQHCRDQLIVTDHSMCSLTPAATPRREDRVASSQSYWNRPHAPQLPLCKSIMHSINALMHY